MHSPYDPASLLSGAHPREMKTYDHTKKSVYECLWQLYPYSPRKLEIIKYPLTGKQTVQYSGELLSNKMSETTDSQK